jgi:uncharacterized phage protein (TIGR02218 family)
MSVTYVPSALLAFLLTRPTNAARADLFTITLTGGAVLRWTSWAQDVTFTPAETGVKTTWLAGPPHLTRGNTNVSAGLSTDSHDCQVLDPGTLINGVPLLERIHRGDFDLATYQLDRAFAPSAGAAWIDCLNKFYGQITDVQDLNSNGCKFTVKSMLHLFDSNWPRNIIESQCLNTLFDAGCGLSASAFVVAGTVHTGSNGNTLVTGLSNPDGYFDRGRVVFTSGPMTGKAALVKSYVGGTASFSGPLPYVPTVGDTFNIYPGCDKTSATCTAKFSNLVNFAGFPFVPAPEVAL